MRLTGLDINSYRYFARRLGWTGLTEAETRLLFRVYGKWVPSQTTFALSERIVYRVR